MPEPSARRAIDHNGIAHRTAHYPRPREVHPSRARSLISAPDRHGIAHWPQVPDLRKLCPTTSYRSVANVSNRSPARSCSLRVVRGAPAGSSCAPLAGIRRQCGDEPALGTGTLAAHNGAQPFEPTTKLPRERLSRPCRCCCAERGPPNVPPRDSHCRRHGEAWVSLRRPN